MNEIVSYLDNKIIEAYKERLLHIKKNYDIIKEECLKIPLNDFTPFDDGNKNNNYWNVYLLKKISTRADNKNYAPQTTKMLCADNSIINAFFSVSFPHSKIHPHRDTLYFLYRSHLGISVPNDCAFICNKIDITAKNGMINFFDLTHEHQGYNNSNDHRIVLIIDVLKNEYPSIPIMMHL